MKKPAVLFIIILVFTISFGCTKRTDIDESEEEQIKIADGAACLVSPDIVGKILEVDTTNVVRVLVDSTTDGIKGQICVTIDKNVVFVKEEEGSNIDNIDVDQYFKIGNIVALLSDGVIMESYPMQTSAISVYDSLG